MCVIALINECGVVAALGAPHLSVAGLFLNLSCLPIVLVGIRAYGVDVLVHVRRSQQAKVEKDNCRCDI